MLCALYRVKSKRLKKKIEKKSLNVPTVKLFSNFCFNILSGVLMFFGFPHLIYGEFVSICWFASFYCLKWPLKFKIIQNLLRNDRWLQIGLQMVRNINWIKCDELGVNGPISWTHRTQNIRKNLNLHPQQSQITLFTLPWDTLL